jgi:hypothetical protein
VAARCKQKHPIVGTPEELQSRVYVAACPPNNELLYSDPFFAKVLLRLLSAVCSLLSAPLSSTLL